MKKLRILSPAVMAVALGTLASASRAAQIDVAAVVNDIGSQVMPITAVGGAILLVVVGIAAFKWVRRAIS